MTATVEPQERFTLWKVDPGTFKIVLTKPAPLAISMVAASASRIDALYAVDLPFLFGPWLDRMREARSWLEARLAKRESWFVDDDG